MTQSRLAVRPHMPESQLRVEFRQYPLLTPEEVSRFFGRDDPQLRQLVIWVGRKYPYLVLQRVNYDTHGLFRDERGNPLFGPRPHG